MTPETALRQAHYTAEVYAENTFDTLLNLLGLDRRGWFESVPEAEKLKIIGTIAPVWAAMIAASAADFDTAMRGGCIDGYRERENA